MTAPVRRPFLVTLLVALVVIGGIVSITAGIIAMTISGFFSVALIPLLVGLAYFAVAKGLADGNPVARAIVAVLAAVQIVYAIFTIINTNDSGTRTSAIGTGIWSVVILAILFAPKANEFFRAH